MHYAFRTIVLAVVVCPGCIPVLLIDAMTVMDVDDRKVAAASANQPGDQGHQGPGRKPNQLEPLQSKRYSVPATCDAFMLSRFRDWKYTALSTRSRAL